MGKERGWGVFEGAESIFFRWFAPKLRVGGCSRNCVLTRGSAPRPRALHPSDGPTFLTDNLWVGISFDGTKLWQASFVHFAVGDLGSDHMPLGSWILLRGSEKKAIITQLAKVYDLNADLCTLRERPLSGRLNICVNFT